MEVELPGVHPAPIFELPGEPRGEFGQENNLGVLIMENLEK